MINNKALLVDERISKISRRKLEDLGYEIILMPQNNLYPSPICAHPDIFAVKIKDMWFVDSDVNELFTFTEEKTVINRGVSGNEVTYPDDVKLNCAYFANKLICNVKFAAKEIISFAEKNNITIINTNQGYSKCSTCIVNDNAIITEDESIEKAAVANGIDVLKITKGYVKLDGYDYGFIGGCSGLIDKNILAFNGCIENHPDYLRIQSFCRKYDVLALSLNDEELYDIGSIVRL